MKSDDSMPTVNTRMPCAWSCEIAASSVVTLPTSSPSESTTTRAAPSAEPRTCATAAASASHRRVPSARGGALASAACTCFGSVVSGRATFGVALKNTTDSGWPGLRAANARAACMAAWIEPFMLLEASIRSTVPRPFAEADESTARFSTGVPSSVTVTSSVVRAGLRGSGSVRTYARSGKSAFPASTTWTPLSSAAAAGKAPIAASAASKARTMRLRRRLTDGGPRRSWGRGAARTARRATRFRALRTCRGRRGEARSTGAHR